MAIQKTFLDTSGFYSAISAEDIHHGQVNTVLRDSKRSFFTTDWVLGESVNLFTARRHAHLGIRLLEQVGASPNIKIIFGGENLFWAARSMLFQYRDHGFPFTDCTSFVVMRELGIKDALTVDRHFRTAGFHPLLVD